MYLFYLEKSNSFSIAYFIICKLPSYFEAFHVVGRKFSFQLTWLVTPPSAKLPYRQVGLLPPNSPPGFGHKYSLSLLCPLYFFKFQQIRKLNQVWWKFKFGWTVKNFNIISHNAYGVLKHIIKKNLRLKVSGNQYPIQSKNCFYGILDKASLYV